MTENGNIRRTLIILTAYSFLLSFAIFPISEALIMGGWHGGSARFSAFAVIGFFCLIPSIFYWPVAHCLLLSGKSPRFVHLTYWVVIMPITICLVFFIFWMIANAFD